MSKPVTSKSKSMFEVRQLLELDPEQLLVPPCQLGQAVVGQHEGALELRGQVLDHDGRHLLQAKSLRCLQAAVASKDHTFSLITIGMMKPNLRTLAPIC